MGQLRDSEVSIDERVTATTRESSGEKESERSWRALFACRAPSLLSTIGYELSRTAWATRW